MPVFECKWTAIGYLTQLLCSSYMGKGVEVAMLLEMVPFKHEKAVLPSIVAGPYNAAGDISDPQGKLVCDTKPVGWPRSTPRFLPVSEAALYLVYVRRAI